MSSQVTPALMWYIGTRRQDGMSKKKLVVVILACAIAIIVLVAFLPKPPTYTLTVGISPPGAGSVSPAGGKYKPGEQVMLRANAASGYTFDHWSGDASGTAPTVTITMDSARHITAYFAAEVRPPVETRVTRVIDGDTIEVSIGESIYKVRYIGLDAPEIAHYPQPAECFGKEASDKNSELVEGKTLRLEKDVSETDQYGRLLRYVWVGDIFVNDYLVRQGYAYAHTYPPDVEHQEQLTQAQREARENNRGLWAICE
jgi:uncharacterized repeat protein (TIGR02543 family)